MRSVLFVCLGNICRSPMAKFMLRDLLDQNGLERVAVDSAGISDEEVGNGLYPGARRALERRGVPLAEHRARRLQKGDYERFDCIVGMEKSHVEAMRRLFGGDPQGKLCRLLDLTDRPGDIADPWYTGDFDTTYAQLQSGCQALLKRALEQGAKP